MSKSTIQKGTYESDFTVFGNATLQDSTLSWKARGLLVYLLSMPHDWKVYVTEIANHSTDGVSATRTGINELIEAGYITRERIHGKDGRIESWNYYVYPEPHAGFPHVDNPDVDNRTLQNIHEQNKHDTKDDNDSNESLCDAKALRSELASYFRERTGIQFPSGKGKFKTLNKLWWQPLLEIAQMCDNDVSRTHRLIDWAVKDMDAKDLCIQTPASIRAVAVAEQAKRKRISCSTPEQVYVVNDDIQLMQQERIEERAREREERPELAVWAEALAFLKGSLPKATYAMYMQPLEVLPPTQDAFRLSASTDHVFEFVAHRLVPKLQLALYSVGGPSQVEIVKGG